MYPLSLSLRSIFPIPTILHYFKLHINLLIDFYKKSRLKRKIFQKNGFRLAFKIGLCSNNRTAEDFILCESKKKEDNFKLPKKITLAKFAGFCYGVKRAVDTAKKLKTENSDRNINVLGELIHNAQVIEELDSMGIHTLNELPDKGDGICIIRSHGESPETFEAIKNAGFEVYDLTCPDVKKVQQKAIDFAKNGYYVVIVGKEQHPEVAAIKANAAQFSKKIIVAESPEQLKQHENELKGNKIGVVVQTTQIRSVLEQISEYLNSVTDNVIIENTICKSTTMRQEEAKELAHNNDLVIVVGSKRSANTSNLAEEVSKITQAIHIETANELEKYSDIINKAQTIAITAGASTPQNIIDMVLKKLEEEE